MIRFEKVCKTFNGKNVLDQLSFEVKNGETYVIMGPSGTGKSVTLKHIIGVHKPDSGKIFVDDIDLATVGPKELKGLRQEMGYLFQDGALINWLNVFDNVALPLRENTRLSKEEIEERVRSKLELVQLSADADKMPDVISGGMRKRVGLARALITDPSIILYDEPTSALDPEISSSINHLIIDLQERLGVTSLVVTHSLSCAFTVADRIAVFDKGHIVQEGTPEEIRHTDNERVRRFLGDLLD